MRRVCVLGTWPSIVLAEHELSALGRRPSANGYMQESVRSFAGPLRAQLMAESRELSAEGSHSAHPTEGSRGSPAAVRRVILYQYPQIVHPILPLHSGRVLRPQAVILREREHLCRVADAVRLRPGG